MCLKVKCLLVLIVSCSIESYEALHLPIERILDSKWNEEVNYYEPYEIVKIHHKSKDDRDHWELEFLAFNM